jgi:phosphoglycolate phosphatase
MLTDSSWALPSPLHAVAFDLDGTLLDSFACQLAASLATYPHFGIAMDEAAYFDAWRPDRYATYTYLGVPPDQWDAIDARWRAEVNRNPPAFFPGACELLHALAERYSLALVTAGTRSRVLDDLARGGIAGCFTAVVAASDVTRPKPDPEGLLLALDRLGVPPGAALYVGDADADADAARASGVAFVGIRGRFNTFTAESGFPVLESIADLAALLHA